MSAVWKFSVFAIVLLLMTTLAADAAEVALCSRANCDCQQPTVAAEGTSVVTSAPGGGVCVCFCGSEIGAECNSDGQCVRGAYCKYQYSGSDAKHADKGLCASKCERHQCPQFHDCHVNSVTGEPSCNCATFNCETEVLVPVCATAPEDREVHRFNNTCLFVNENCKRQLTSLSVMQSFGCDTA